MIQLLRMRNLAGCLLAFAIITPASAQQSKKEPNCAGDFKCEHDKFHKGYQELFKKYKRCQCHTGYCRPSKIMAWPVSPTRYAVAIDGCWYPVSKDVVIRSHEMKPTMRRLLYGAIIHVCAYPTIDASYGTAPVHPWREGEKNVEKHGFQCSNVIIECVAESGGT